MKTWMRLPTLLSCLFLCAGFVVPRVPENSGEASVRHIPVPAAVVETAATAQWGARGPEHCALAIGIFLGGALGFWVNPFLGTQAMRLGLMASVLHCS